MPKNVTIQQCNGEKNIRKQLILIRKLLRTQNNFTYTPKRSSIYVYNKRTQRDVPGVARGDAVVGSRAPALERVAPIDDTLGRDAEVPQPVVLLLDAGVGHTGHSGALLRQAEIVRPARGPAARCLHRLRPAVVRTTVSEVRDSWFSDGYNFL